MNTSTGAIVSNEFVQSLTPDKQKNYIEVKRDLSVKETSDKQIQLYSLCGCGSGKKFKFCCKIK